LRKIQQSSTPGLSNIFLKKYKDIKLHRPLIKYSKKQIKSYSNKNKLIWFEDRSNLELHYTRNKIRNFLYSKKLFKQINSERVKFSKITILHFLHQNFFKRKRNKIFEIEIEKFNHLSENLKFYAVQSFYYEYRNLLKKQIRDENIRNFIKILKAHLINNKEMSVFSGKIGVIKKKICINLT
jgi:Predicted ATPase of the PP-loop superfamily implicated in cell cycle control